MGVRTAKHQRREHRKRKAAKKRDAGYLGPDGVADVLERAIGDRPVVFVTPETPDEEVEGLDENTALVFTSSPIEDDRPAH